MHRLVVSLAFTLVAACLPAMAQQHAPTTPDPKACAPDERMPPMRGPGAGATTGENLSDKLARTDGVICPQEVDPQMNAPAPDTGKMRVIPPPGAPGGNPDVRPK